MSLPLPWASIGLLLESSFLPREVRDTEVSIWVVTDRLRFLALNLLRVVYTLFPILGECLMSLWGYFYKTVPKWDFPNICSHKIVDYSEE